MDPFLLIQSINRPIRYYIALVSYVCRWLFVCWLLIAIKPG